MNGPETIRTRDARKLSLTVYRPLRENQRVLVVGGSAYATQDLYCQLALYLTLYDYTVVTFDYRGVGASALTPLRKDRSKLHQWARLDLDAVLLYTKKCFPDKELIYLGHGIGGEFFALAAASQYINRLVLINAAHTCSALWSWKGRLRKEGIRLLIPLLTTVFGYFPAIKPLYLPRLPKGVMQEWAHWCSRRNGLFDVYPDCNYRKLQIPALSLSFTDDWTAPGRAVSSLHRHLGDALVIGHRYGPADLGLKKVGHAGFFHKLPNDILWQKLLCWLSE